MDKWLYMYNNGGSSSARVNNKTSPWGMVYSNHSSSSADAMSWAVQRYHEEAVRKGQLDILNYRSRFPLGSWVIDISNSTNHKLKVVMHYSEFMWVESLVTGSYKVHPDFLRETSEPDLGDML